MQKTFLPAAIFAAVSVLFIAHAPSTVKKQTVYAEDDENPAGRLKWELSRLADPSTGKIPDHIRQKELAFASTLPSDACLQSRIQSQWNARGPWNVGGRTRALAMDVLDENTLVAGNTSGGIWKTTDGGTTWTKVTPPLQNPGITCIAQDTRVGKTNTWYAGTGEGYGQSAGETGAYYLGNGLLTSTDNGNTWTPIASTVSNTPQTFDKWGDIVWNIALNPADTANDVIYAAGCLTGILKSINGGTTWTAVKGTITPSGSSSYFTDVAVTPTGVIYCTLSSDGGQKGIWRSPDGVNWTQIIPGNFPAAYNRLVIGISPQDESQVYILGNTPNAGMPDTNFLGQVEWNSLWKYKYLSGNGSGSGGLWTDLSANVPSRGGLFDKFNCQGSYDLVVRVHPNDTNTVFIGGTDLYRSTSGFYDTLSTTFIGGYQKGATLPVVNVYQNHHPDQHHLLFKPSNPSVMYSSNDGGIFRTNDCLASSVTWTTLNNGYLTSMFYTCALDHAQNTDIVIGGAQDNGSWFTNNTNLTTPWVTPRGGDGSYCYVADNAANYYFSIQNGKMMRSTLDGSGNVLTFARIDPIGGKGYQFINPYTIDPNNMNRMYLAGGKNLWRNDSLNFIPMVGNYDSISKGWIKFPDTVPTTNATITAVAVSKNPANIVFYGTSSKRVYRVDNANIGTPTPLDITPTTLFPGAYVSCVAIDPTDANKVMVAFSNYSTYSIFSTANALAAVPTWVKAGGNLEQFVNGTGNGPSVRWLSIMPVSDGTVYLAATSTGLYATDTLMGTSTVWVQQGTNTIGNVVCDMIDWRASDGRVIVATHANGIYSSVITSVNDVATVHNIENSNELTLNNYPNPFSSQTTIEYSLKERSKVMLNVLDERGRIVQPLVNTEQNAGRYALVFDRKGLANGIYYCSLEAGPLRKTAKLMLIE